MKRARILLLPAIAGGVVWSIGRPPEIPFQKSAIDLGASETAAFADINGDKLPDIVSGEFWYEAPKWTPHRSPEIDFTDNYIDTSATRRSTWTETAASTS